MIKSICVCGAGSMGRGIAQAAAQAGFPTILFDVDAAALDKARDAISAGLQLLVGKNKITAEKKDEAFSQLSFTANIQHCVADLIIEAIVEKQEVKTKLFQQLAAINTAETIFATNTSSLSVTAMASDIEAPARFIGMHFFNPVHAMKLVEVVTTAKTSPAVKEEIFSLAKSLGKTPVACKDSPGFIVNRVARPFYIEALRLAEMAAAGYTTIDTLLEAAGFKMGPFRLMDLIGNDVNYTVSCSVYEQLGKPERLKPSFIQQEKVEKKELGKKTGKGYYEYAL
jgi:3-hydroxybutyryl-CoA dehydrogenase